MEETLKQKRSEMEEILALAKQEERGLNEEEQAKFNGLETEVRELEANIEKENIERIEREAKEAQEALEQLERETKDLAKAEIETSLRAMSMIDAEAELEKAYIELDRAWENYWEACREKEEEDRKEELRGLIKQVLSEFNQRNLQLEEEKLIAEREAALAEREAKIAEQEEALKAEREAKKAEELKEQERQLELEKQRSKMEEKTIYDAVREASGSQVAETITVQRADADGDTTAMTKGIPLVVKEIDRIGKKPMYLNMGLDIMMGAKGTYQLPFDDPRVGEELAELASITGDAVSPDGVLVSPKRFGTSKTFTVEAIASATDAFIQSIMNDLRQANGRKITAAVYTKALAGATEVSTADALDRDSLIDLMAAVEVDEDGAFMSARSTFFETMKVAVDAGSGKFLSTMINADGETVTYVTETGSPYFYSSLFDDGTNQQYVVYGDLSKIHLADYGTEQVIVDPYTKAAEGQVIITVVKLMGIALKNPNAFSKTVDLDAAV